MRHQTELVSTFYFFWSARVAASCFWLIYTSCSLVLTDQKLLSSDWIQHIDCFSVESLWINRRTEPKLILFGVVSYDAAVSSHNLLQLFCRLVLPLFFFFMETWLIVTDLLALCSLEPADVRRSFNLPLLLLTICRLDDFFSELVVQLLVGSGLIVIVGFHRIRFSVPQSLMFFQSACWRWWSHEKQSESDCYRQPQNLLILSIKIWRIPLGWQNPVAAIPTDGAN
jgi:hypothetical protein